jgi:hypothetical protein
MSAWSRIVIPLIVLLAATPLLADDISGANQFICTTHDVFECEAGAECYEVSLDDLKLPAFVMVDLDKKTMKTTEASNQQRSTEIKNLEFFDPLIVIQTAQLGRGMTWVIHEPTGRSTMTVTIHHEAYVFFGTCTPLPAK